MNIVFTTFIGFLFVMVYAASWPALGDRRAYLLTILILSWVSITLGQKIKVTQRKIVTETSALAALRLSPFGTSNW